MERLGALCLRHAATTDMLHQVTNVHTFSFDLAVWVSRGFLKQLPAQQSLADLEDMSARRVERQARSQPGTKPRIGQASEGSAGSK